MLFLRLICCVPGRHPAGLNAIDKLTQLEADAWWDTHMRRTQRRCLGERCFGKVSKRPYRIGRGNQVRLHAFCLSANWLGSHLLLCPVWTNGGKHQPQCGCIASADCWPRVSSDVANIVTFTGFSVPHPLPCRHACVTMQRRWACAECILSMCNEPLPACQKVSCQATRFPILSRCCRSPSSLSPLC